MSNIKKEGEEKKPKISVSINSDLVELLEEYLQDKNVNRSKYIENLIKKDIEERLKNKNVMKILNFKNYKDGGTIEVETNEGTFCFDGRIKSIYKDNWYKGYPEPDNSNIIENFIELEKQILEALTEFNITYNGWYHAMIENFIEERLK